MVKAETSRKKSPSTAEEQGPRIPPPKSKGCTIQNTAHEIDSQLMVWEIGLKRPKTIGIRYAMGSNGQRTALGSKGGLSNPAAERTVEGEEDEVV